MKSKELVKYQFLKYAIIEPIGFITDTDHTLKI